MGETSSLTNARQSRVEQLTNKPTQEASPPIVKRLWDHERLVWLGTWMAISPCAAAYCRSATLYPSRVSIDVELDV
jgi:hypothetical protein